MPKNNFHRKDALKRHQQKFRSNKRKIELWVPIKRYSTLADNARRHNMKLSAYCREVIDKYEEQGFILPDDTQVHLMRMGFRKIGTNVNQIARVCNSTNSVHRDKVELLSKNVYELEQTVAKAFLQPLTMEQFVRDGIESPHFRPRLEFLLQQYS